MGNRTQAARLKVYEKDIIAALNNESATVSQLANQYGLDKGLIRNATYRWKEMRLLRRDVNIRMNANPAAPKKVKQILPFYNGVTKEEGDGARYVIYTDGSAFLKKGHSQGDGGWAILIVDRQQSSQPAEYYGCDTVVDANRMELLAIYHGLKCLPDREIGKFYSDSQYACDMLSRLRWFQRRGWQTAAGKLCSNVDILRNLYEIVDVKKFSLEWIRGHSGTRENVRVDELARTAAREQLSKPYDDLIQKEGGAHMISGTFPEGAISVSDAAAILSLSTTSVDNMGKRGVLSFGFTTGTPRRKFYYRNEIVAIKELQYKIGCPFTTITRSNVETQLVQNGKVVKLPEKDWGDMSYTLDFFGCSEDQLALFVGRDWIETAVKDGRVQYNIETCQIDAIREYLEGGESEEDQAAVSLLLELDDEITPAEDPSDQIENDSAATADIGTKDDLHACGNVLEKLEDDEMKDNITCDCSTDERKFANMYMMFGAAAAARKFNMSKDEAKQKWKELLVDYVVELVIKKR